MHWSQTDVVWAPGECEAEGWFPYHFNFSRQSRIQESGLHGSGCAVRGQQELLLQRHSSTVPHTTAATVGTRADSRDRRGQSPRLSRT